MEPYPQQAEESMKSFPVCLAALSLPLLVDELVTGGPGGGLVYYRRP